jgi:hypothetical protein
MASRWMRTLTIGASDVLVSELPPIGGPDFTRCCSAVIAGNVGGSVFVWLEGMSSTDEPQELVLPANTGRGAKVRRIRGTDGAAETASAPIKIELHWDGSDL